MSDEHASGTSTRDRIAETAKRWQQSNVRAGNPMTHTEAVRRVTEARRKGDRKRNE